MLSLLQGFPLVASLKIVGITALVAIICGAYLNHKDLKAEVITQKTKINQYEQEKKQSQQVNVENNQTIKQLKQEIIAQQARQLRHEQALIAAVANKQETQRALSKLKAINEKVKQWLDASHSNDIGRLLNNARARYTNTNQNKNDKTSAAN